MTKEFFKPGVDLHKLARRTTLTIWVLLAGSVTAGLKLSPWFHIGSGVFGLLTLMDLYYRLFQSRHAVLRNFGIMGTIRYALESVGPEMRQYIVASDYEERPFNRRERSEVYRYAKDEPVKSAAFGTVLDKSEHPIRHSMFPLEPRELEPFKLTFGDERGCEAPYTIVRPFMISAMSFGSLGENAVRALSRGARMAKIPICTGEGGFPRHHLAEGADVIFQMGTAKFGVRNDDGTLDEKKLKELTANTQVKMVEIKMSQGAKPGKGGLLPAAKVTREIAELRGVPVGREVVSPPRHPECEDVESTVTFIGRVQALISVPVGIKFCLGRPDEFEALVFEMKNQGVFPDYIAVDGAEGGTGAAPAAFMDHVGMPIYPALTSVVNILNESGVRDRLKVVAAGKLINPGRQLKALARGADAVYSARGFMLALGCIQAMQCNADTCPVGITTHRRFLQRGLVVGEKAKRIVNYANELQHTLEHLLAATGHHSFASLTPDTIVEEHLDTAWN